MEKARPRAGSKKTQPAKEITMRRPDCQPAKAALGDKYGMTGTNTDTLRQAFLKPVEIKADQTTGL